MSEEANKDKPLNDEPRKPWLESLGLPVGKKKFWSSDKFLSLLAFLISIGTLFTFAYQTYLIQKQQYANMMPYLMIIGGGDGHGPYDIVRLGVVNNGVGPAFIRDVKIYYQDSVYHQAPSMFYSNQIDPDDSLNYSINNGFIAPGYVIPAEGEILLIESNSENSTTMIKKLFTSSKA